MGGAVGHIQHLHENRELTFKELKDILKRASDGELQEVTEKLDGMNLMFTWSGELRLARSVTDIKLQGMTPQNLSTKFMDRGNVSAAFMGAVDVLLRSMAAIPDDVKLAIFQAGSLWYSIEIIYPENQNVINYDTNGLVFHGWPIYRRESSGNVKEGPDAGVTVLLEYIQNMQAVVGQQNWKLHGPAIVQMKKLGDSRALDRAKREINAARDSVGLSDGDSLVDYLRRCVMKDVKRELPELTQDCQINVMQRACELPRALTRVELKRSIPKFVHKRLDVFLDCGSTLVKKHMQPIESAIYDFAVEVLKNVSSLMVRDGESEIIRLRKAVKQAILQADRLSDDGQRSKLEKQLSRLGSVENISSPVEGIVFMHRGQAYKLTGAFAPVNQILGLFKYGTHR